MTSPPPTWVVYHDDCVKAMAAMPEASIDAIVTDPPYGLGFMGKEWDTIGDTGRGARVRSERAAEVTPTGNGHSTSAGPYLAAGVDSLRSAGRPYQAWCEAWAREALRVLRPGGHLLAFGGTRTSHRLACAIEDAGFEIRDCLAWMYGQGFPKSLDVSKAITGHLVAGGSSRTQNRRAAMGDDYVPNDGAGKGPARTTITQTVAPPDVQAVAAEAKPWQGWGTSLKPAHEPIVLARKPLSGTVAANVLEHGTGALNIDGCRIDGRERTEYGLAGATRTRGVTYGEPSRSASFDSSAGRWPANVVLDERAAAMLDERTSHLQMGVTVNRNRDPESIKPASVYGAFRNGDRSDVSYGDSGGASRFYYCAKASTRERTAGLVEGLPRCRNARKRYQQDAAGRWAPRAGNRHPTVKPMDLMRWLVRLVTPPGGVVLDPFAGSGTTGAAAMQEGFSFVGIERDPAYVPIARARIAWWAGQPVAQLKRSPATCAQAPEAKSKRPACKPKATVPSPFAPTLFDVGDVA
jgi:DNA modification methylase